MRAIISTPDVLGGRWRLEGHRIHVSAIRNWITECGLNAFNDEFPHVNLTQEEADACLAWPFPPIQGKPARMDADYGYDLICVCGEYATLRDDGVWHCPYCRKDWVMTVRIKQATKEATR